MAVTTIDNNNHSPSSLLMQHQQLLVLLRLMEDQLPLVAPIERGAGDDNVQELLALLSDFLSLLATHFKTEMTCAGRDFADVPHLQTAVAELDEEHPLLLACFVRAQDALRASTSPSETTRLLERAIARFRAHEAREDAIFADN